MNDAHLEALVALLEQIQDDRQFDGSHAARAPDEDVFLVLHGSICRVSRKSKVFERKFRSKSMLLACDHVSSAKTWLRHATHAFDLEERLQISFGST